VFPKVEIPETLSCGNVDALFPETTIEVALIIPVALIVTPVPTSSPFLTLKL
jgi:hypothetical protein